MGLSVGKFGSPARIGCVPCCTVVGDLKDALFTLVLMSLSYPVYFFVARSKMLRASTSDAIAVPPE
jgi:hypothetical protein